MPANATSSPAAAESSPATTKIIKRSDEAIKRRAEKRGRTFDEQFLKDLKKKKKKTAEGEGASEGGNAKDVERKSSTSSRSTGSGKWVCGKCNNENFAGRQECNRCQTLPTPIRKNDDNKKMTTTAGPSKAVHATTLTNWLCAQCNNDNYATRRECNRCKVPRAASGPKNSTNPSDQQQQETPFVEAGKWVCGQCTNLNYAKRTECNRCQAPKVGNAVKIETATAISNKPPSARKAIGPSTRQSALKGEDSGGGSAQWSIKPASADDIEENSLLRSLGLLAETDPLLPEWLLLTLEEQERAKILIERSRRKANKRSKAAQKERVLPTQKRLR